MSYMDCCDWNKCTLCGECLMKCPVMKMGQNEAKSEFSNLLKGEPAPRVFSECTLCFSCNNYCPEGLRPYELILQRVTEQGDRKKRLPALVPYFLNGMPGPTLWKDLYSKLKPREKKILDKWSVPPKESKEVLFMGCIGKLFTEDIENSKVLEPLAKFGPPDICCGELHYRSGQWKAYCEITERTLKRFSELEAERIVFYCGSCYTFLGNMLPKVYGKELPFKLTSLYEWLLEKTERGDIEVKRPIEHRAAIHESCYASELGPGFYEPLRKLYKKAGADIVELEHNRENNLSCGAASIVRNFSLFQMMKEQGKKFKEVKNTGVDKVALNCPGCYLTLAATNRLYGVKMLYMPEILLRAFGDDIKKPISKMVFPTLKALGKRLPRAFKKVDAALPEIPVE